MYVQCRSLETPITFYFWSYKPTMETHHWQLASDKPTLIVDSVLAQEAYLGFRSSCPCVVGAQWHKWRWGLGANRTPKLHPKADGFTWLKGLDCSETKQTVPVAYRMQLQIFTWLRTNSGLSNREQKPAAAFSLGDVSFLFSDGKIDYLFASSIFR